MASATVNSEPRVERWAGKFAHRNMWVIVLAGGDGRRLGALLTDEQGRSIPKQYCSLDGGCSLLQLAVHRARGLVPQERIVVVVTDSHRRWWEPELQALRRATVVVQPSNRGSGLGLLLPLLTIAKRDPQAAFMSLPCDHYVEHEDMLAEHLRQAVTPDVVESDKLTLLGMMPNSPDPDFGYWIPSKTGIGIRPVGRFVDRPDREAAGILMKSGGVWNSGIISGRIAQIVRLYPRPKQGDMLALKAVVEYWRDIKTPSAELAALYTRLAPLDMTRDVLAIQPQFLQVLPVPPCGWHDLGTPERLAVAVSTLRSRRSNAQSWNGRVFNLAAHVERAY